MTNRKKIFLTLTMMVLCLCVIAQGRNTRNNRTCPLYKSELCTPNKACVRAESGRCAYTCGRKECPQVCPQTAVRGRKNVAKGRRACVQKPCYRSSAYSPGCNNGRGRCGRW